MSHGPIRKLMNLSAIFTLGIVVVVAIVTGILIFRAARRVGIVAALYWWLDDLLNDFGSDTFANVLRTLAFVDDPSSSGEGERFVPRSHYGKSLRNGHSQRDGVDS